MPPKRQAPAKRHLHRMPRVAILLESTHEASRGRLRGVMKYIDLYGPWGLHIITGGTEEQRLPTLKHWKATGILARIPNRNIARAVVAAGLPTVLFDPIELFLRPRHPLSQCCRSSCDNRTIGRLAAEHFIEQGFEHFAIVPDNIRPIWAQARFDGFERRAAEERHTVAYYPVSPENAADWGLEVRRMIRWIRRLPKPLAIFTPHDLRGRQVLDACLGADIRVPHEVAVIGVDNDEQVCMTCTPHLSSVAVDTESGGFAAAEMLDRLMRGLPVEQREFTYPVQGVVHRASSELVSFNDPVVLRAKEFIRINSGFAIRVSDVAKHLKLSRRAVEIRFKKALGHTILEEIQQVRMEAIRRLVAQTETPFGKIAELSGLDSGGHLGEIFKKEFGVTMGEYRKSHATQ